MRELVLVVCLSQRGCNMTQALFLTEEEVKKRKKNELINRCMTIWAESATEYRLLPYKYFFLLNEKRAAGLPLRKLKIDLLADYPEVCFFRIFDEPSAKAWLEDMELDTLERELDHLESLSTNYSYVSLKSWVFDTIYSLSRK